MANIQVFEYQNSKVRTVDIPKNDFASDYVLVHDKEAGDWVAYYDANGGWCEARECIPFKNVTHWMPMPEPPTED